MENNKKMNSLKVKDLLLIGLLALCYILIQSVGSVLGFSPYTYLAAFPLVGLLSGILIFLLMAKVPKKGAFLIYTIVSALVFLMSGWIWLCILTALAGIVSELVFAKMGYKNKKATTIAHMLRHFAFAFGSYIPYLFYGQQYIEKYSEIYGQEYMELSVGLITPLSTVILMIINLIFAFVGALIAMKLMKKHFVKAGMV